MNYEQMNNNRVHIRGKIISAPKYTHQVFEEDFYEMDVEVARLSEIVDVIPITVSEKLLNENTFDIGSTISINGQFRSYNKQIEGKSKLVLTVFARELVQDNDDVNPNLIELTGYVCKPPVFRTTPFKREICDILLAVNRAYNKSDYLPCIAWGRNARFVKNINVGEKVSLSGRIQSREYEKRIDENTAEKKVAYEISITRINRESDSGAVETEQMEQMIPPAILDTKNYVSAD